LCPYFVLNFIVYRFIETFKTKSNEKSKSIKTNRNQIKNKVK